MSRKLILPSSSPLAPGLKDESGAYLLQTPGITKLLNLGQSFPEQYAFTQDPSRYIAAQCSRRGGKTNGLAIRFFKTLAKYPRSQCVYLALTRDSAKEIMWPVLQEINDKYGLGCEFKESTLEMKYKSNGSVLKLWGADMKNFIKRLKGRKYPGVGIDEAQDFGGHLQSLVDDVLTPSIADYEDGWLAITGTPGPVPNGYFFDITQQRRYGFSFHSWTILENPYMPNPQKFLEDLLAKREWDETNPTYLREYKNRWVLDVQSLWVVYKESLNNYEKISPQLENKMHYILGIDLGWRDADALAVLGWSENEPVTYLIEELITKKQGITELTNQIETLQKKYTFDKIVMDEGGLGKKIGEEIRRQKHLPIHGADKQLKQQNVGFLNDALGLGRFKAKSNSRFAKDSYVVQIDWDKSTPDKIVIRKHPHSDIIDAVLYAFKESPAFTYRDPPKKPEYGSKEWAEAQQDEMREAALDYFTKQSEKERGYNTDNY